MSSNRGVRWLFACALMLVAPLAFGVEQTRQQQTGRMQEKMTGEAANAEHAELARGTAVIGHEVLDAQGNRIGKIDDVVLNERGDQIIYAALSRGGVAGVGAKLFAIPWSDYRITPVAMEQTKPSGLMGDENQKFKITLLNVSKDELDKANGFKSSEWPMQAQTNWREQTMTQERKAEQAKVWRLSKLFGQEVESQHSLQAAKPEKSMRGEEMAGNRIGQLKDAALSINTGRPVYGVITLASIKGKENFHSVVPWSALNFKESANNKVIASLNVPDTKTLESFAFKPGSVPALTDRRYAEQVYTAYNQRPDFEVLGFVSPEQGTMQHRRTGESPSGSQMKTEPQNQGQPRSGSQTNTERNY